MSPPFPLIFIFKGGGGGMVFHRENGEIEFLFGMRG